AEQDRRVVEEGGDDRPPAVGRAHGEVVVGDVLVAVDRPQRGAVVGQQRDVGGGGAGDVGRLPGQRPGDLVRGGRGGGRLGQAGEQPAGHGVRPGAVAQPGPGQRLGAHLGDGGQAGEGQLVGRGAGRPG